MRSYFHTGVRLRYAVATNYDLALTFSLGSMEDKWQGMYMFDHSKGSNGAWTLTGETKNFVNVLLFIF